MTKKLITAIIALCFLVESRGMDCLSFAVSVQEVALRPIAFKLFNGKTDSITTSYRTKNIESYSARNVSWTEDSLRDWLLENCEEAKELMGKEQFSERIQPILEILKGEEESNSKRKKALTPHFVYIGFIKPGRLIDQLLKAKPPVKIDERIAIQLTPDVFLVSKEVMMLWEMRSYFIAQKPDTNKSREDQLKEAIEKRATHAGNCIRLDFDDIFLELFYETLVYITGLAESEYHMWFANNKTSIITQLAVLYRKGNYTFSIDALRKIDNDDEARLILAHEFLHGKLHEYYRSLTGSARYNFRSEIKTMLGAQRQTIQLILTLFPEYKDTFSDESSLFYRFDEFITQMLYPASASAETVAILSESGEVTYISKGKPNETITNLIRNTTNELCEFFPFFGRLNKQVLAKANEILPKIRGILNSIQDSAVLGHSQQSKSMDYSLYPKISCAIKAAA